MTFLDDEDTEEHICKKKNDEMILGMLRLFMERSSCQVQLAVDRGPKLGREIWARVDHLCIYLYLDVISMYQ